MSQNHRARHDRQTVLLQHGAPPVARLRDLNTRSRDAHLVYGHAWDEVTNELFDRATADPKATLIDKATRGVLIGEGVRVILATIDNPDTHGFTLVDFGAAEGAAAFEKAARARGVPLKTLRLAPPEGDLYRSRLVLVRPDQHIAWHGDTAEDALAVVDRVRGA